MAEDRDELLRHYGQMRAELLAAIDGLSDEQLTEPSLDGWSVRDHLGHVAAWDELRAGEIARISAGHDALWRTTPEQEDAFNALTHGLRQAVSVAQARWELETAGRRVREALGAATARGLDGSLYGEAGLFSRHEAQHTRWIERWRGERGL